MIFRNPTSLKILPFLLASGVLVLAQHCGSDGEPVDESDAAADATGSDVSNSDARTDSGTGTDASSSDATQDVVIDAAPTLYGVGGNVAGLVGAPDAGATDAGAGGLVLRNGSAEAGPTELLSVSSSGTFQFPTKLPTGAPFLVTVDSQPKSPSQTCTVSGGSGTVGTADVSSITVNCMTNAFTLGGTVAGLAGGSVELESNGQTATVSANGTFAFAAPIPSGTSYAVTIKTQPAIPAQTCVLSNAAGSISNANVDTVGVVCTTNQYSVIVNTAGLAGSGLVLQNNGSEDLAIGANGNSTFATKVNSGATYAVTVKTQPTNPPQTCTPVSATGTIGSADAVVTLNCAYNWKYVRTIAVANDDAVLTNEPVMVVLDGSIPRGNFAANGADIRFGTTANQSDSLPYYVEEWGNTKSVLWVRVPSVALGNGSLYMFYGNAGAAAASDFGTVFPGAVTVSADTVLTGDVTADWYKVNTGVNVFLPGAWNGSAYVAGTGGNVITLRAKRVILEGTIVGDHAGNPSVSNVVGGGPGGGGTSTNSGAGGGGYGGAGGTGGFDNSDTPGAGGAAHGTATGSDIAVGSAGGSADSGSSGAGGGGLLVRATRITSSAVVRMNGMSPDVLGGRLPGGGSGGGIAFIGLSLSIAGELYANGGNGAPGNSVANDSGGGGGGGRIKGLARLDLSWAPSVISAAFGTGGPNGTQAPGQPGVVGSIHNAVDASVTGVVTAVGSEAVR